MTILPLTKLITWKPRGNGMLREPKAELTLWAIYKISKLRLNNTYIAFIQFIYQYEHEANMSITIQTIQPGRREVGGGSGPCGSLSSSLAARG